LVNEALPCSPSQAAFEADDARAQPAAHAAPLRELIVKWEKTRDELWPFSRSPQDALEGDRYARASTWDSAVKALKAALASPAPPDEESAKEER
jgi:hypothetical protein